MGKAGTDGGRIVNYTENLNYMLSIKKFGKKKFNCAISANTAER